MNLDPASLDRAALGAPLVPRFPIRLRDTEVVTVVYRTRREAIERLLPAQLEARGTLVAVHWRGHSDAHRLHGDEVHRHLAEAPGVRHAGAYVDDGFRLDLWERT